MTADSPVGQLIAACVEYRRVWNSDDECDRADVAMDAVFDALDGVLGTPAPPKRSGTPTLPCPQCKVLMRWIDGPGEDGGGERLWCDDCELDYHLSPAEWDALGLDEDEEEDEDDDPPLAPLDERLPFYKRLLGMEAEVTPRMEKMLAAYNRHGFKDWAAIVEILLEDVEGLRAELNTPQTADFLQAVAAEAAHQRQRFGSTTDAGKRREDWIALLDYLKGKAVAAHYDLGHRLRAMAGNSDSPYIKEAHDKLLHHIISQAAALCNWHAAETGADTRMRPGLGPECP